MSQTNRMLIAMFSLVAVALAFWFLALGPKRQRAGELGKDVATLRSKLATARQEATSAVAAKQGYRRNYQQLVLLGKAVPASDDTSSLLVELNRIGLRSGVKFAGITLDQSMAPATTTTTPPPAPPTTSGSSTATATSATVPATEAAAALLPIGATIGTAGLGVMPYKLTFSGGFFGTARFIGGLDALVETDAKNVAVDGRLLTIDGFSLQPDTALGFPLLQASFSVTTYVTPPAQGLTAGGTPTSPSASAAVATPTSTTTTP